MPPGGPRVYPCRVTGLRPGAGAGGAGRACRLSWCGCAHTLLESDPRVWLLQHSASGPRPKPQAPDPRPLRVRSEAMHLLAVWPVVPRAPSALLLGAPSGGGQGGPPV